MKPFSRLGTMLIALFDMPEQLIPIHISFPPPEQDRTFMSLFKVQYHLGLFVGWDGGTGERQPRAVLLLMWSIKALGINDQLLSHLHANRKSTTCMLLHYLVEIEANGNEYTRNKWRVQTAFCERVFVWQDNIAAGGCSRMARLAKLPSRSLRPTSIVHPPFPIWPQGQADCNSFRK